MEEIIMAEQYLFSAIAKLMHDIEHFTTSIQERHADEPHEDIQQRWSFRRLRQGEHYPK